jgi:hypothetical protein
MKSRERQQIGLTLSPLVAEKLVQFLVAIFPKAKGLSCATLLDFIRSHGNLKPHLLDQELPSPRFCAVPPMPLIKRHRKRSAKR